MHTLEKAMQLHVYSSSQHTDFTLKVSNCLKILTRSLTCSRACGVLTGLACHTPTSVVNLAPTLDTNVSISPAFQYMERGPLGEMCRH